MLNIAQLLARNRGDSLASGLEIAFVAPRRRCAGPRRRMAAPPSE